MAVLHFRHVRVIKRFVVKCLAVLLIDQCIFIPHDHFMEQKALSKVGVDRITPLLTDDNRSNRQLM